MLLLYLNSLTKNKLPNLRQTEAMIVVPFVIILRGPKYGSTQMLYNLYICTIFLSIQ